MDNMEKPPSQWDKGTNLRDDLMQHFKETTGLGACSWRTIDTLGNMRYNLHAKMEPSKLLNHPKYWIDSSKLPELGGKHGYGYEGLQILFYNGGIVYFEVAFRVPK